jgi:AcrR family transcriptional regulator
MSSSRKNARQPPEPVRPLYERLPHGPHKLAPEDVKRNQRARLAGAMIEDSARRGYERVTVKQLIGLAGVSRRSFYELYENKEQCLIATFDRLADSLVARAQSACAGAPRGAEPRLRACLQTLADSAAAETDVWRLVLLESPVAGLAGLRHHHAAAARFEVLLLESLKRGARDPGLPRPLIRAVIGGLLGAFSTHVREGTTHELDAVTDDLVNWTLTCASPAAAALPPPRLQAVARDARANGRAQRPATGGDGRRPSKARWATGERGRMLEQALLLATKIPYREMSALQIVEEAGLPFESFAALFPNLDDCLCAALDAFTDELVDLIADPGTTPIEWPQMVRRRISALTGHLATHPLLTRAVAVETLWASPRVRERSLAIAPKLAEVLTPAAPEGGGRDVVPAVVAGAIWHTVRSHALAGGIAALPSLVDQLAYVVLAPVMGAADAAALVGEAA